jgi:hypothetical protein
MGSRRCLTVREPSAAIGHRLRNRKIALFVRYPLSHHPLETGAPSEAGDGLAWGIATLWGNVAADLLLMHWTVNSQTTLISRYTPLRSTSIFFAFIDFDGRRA